MRRIIASACLSFCVSFAVFAEDRWYVGGALGQSHFGAERDAAYKVYAGYRFTPHLAAEAGYTDLGKRTVVSGTSQIESKPRGGAAHVVLTWPLAGDLPVLGRVGAIYGDTKVTSAGVDQREKGADLAWGVGVQYRMGRQVMARLELERFRFENLDVDALMLGLAATF